MVPRRRRRKEKDFSGQKEAQTEGRKEGRRKEERKEGRRAKPVAQERRERGVWRVGRNDALRSCTSHPRKKLFFFHTLSHVVPAQLAWPFSLLLSSLLQVPFCQQRCQFCEYTVVDPALGKSDHVQDSYFDALLKEFDLYKSLLGTEKKKLVGFDIGGGTPSMASSDNIARIMDKAAECFEMDLNTMNKAAECFDRNHPQDRSK